MQITVIGANGDVGRRLLPRLVDRGHEVAGMVRSEEQFEEVEAAGAEPRLGDLEGEFAEHLSDAQAVVFTAGAGGDTGADKTLMVDLWGAKRAVDAAVDHGVERFVMVSSRGADDPEGGPAFLRPYLVAKHFADEYLLEADIDHTILRPCTLSDDPGTGEVELRREPVRSYDGTVTRDDVAAVVATLLDQHRLQTSTVELYGGATPIDEALRGI